MLRLAHRILAEWRQSEIFYGNSNVEEVNKAFYEMRDTIAQSQVIVADNIADMVYGEDWESPRGDDIGTYYSGMPPCRPPYRIAFVECCVANSEVSQLGWVVCAFDMRTWLERAAQYAGEGWRNEDPDDIGVLLWEIGARKNGKTVWPRRVIKVVLTPAGIVKDARLSQFGGRHVSDNDKTVHATMYAGYIPFLTFAFMNCKNVVKRDTTCEHSPDAKWLRLQKQPEIRYHVLDINPMKEVLRKEGDIEHNGLKRALHICRGHFSTYTDEKPLFGKVSGTFWVPSHVRGSMEQGIVDKDYRVKAPA